MNGAACFVFGRSLVQIIVRRPVIMTCLRGVPQSLQANAEIVP
jgi:hypothetical protein